MTDTGGGFRSDTRRNLFACASSIRESTTMPIRKLIDSTSFAPETLDVIFRAFDLAWAEVAPRFGNDPTAIEFARNRLAQIVMAQSPPEPTDPLPIKTAAVAAFVSALP